LLGATPQGLCVEWGDIEEPLIVTLAPDSLELEHLISGNGARPAKSQTGPPAVVVDRSLP
jgi:hypothetical protein